MDTLSGPYVTPIPRTFRPDYARLNPLCDAGTALGQLGVWFDNYNHNHTHRVRHALAPRVHRCPTTCRGVRLNGRNKSTNRTFLCMKTIRSITLLVKIGTPAFPRVLLREIPATSNGRNPVSIFDHLERHEPEVEFENSHRAAFGTFPGVGNRFAVKVTGQECRK